MDHKRYERLGKIITDLNNALVTYADTGDDLLSSVEQCILRAGKRKQPTTPETRAAASHISMPLGIATTPSQRANPVTSETISSNKRRKVFNKRSEFIKGEQPASEPLSNIIKRELDPSPVPNSGDNGPLNNTVTESAFNHSLIPHSGETSLGNQDYPSESEGEDRVSEYTVTSYGFRRDFQKFLFGTETLELEEIQERSINYQHVESLSNNDGIGELDVSDLSVFPPPIGTELAPDVTRGFQAHQSLPDATLPQLQMSAAHGSTPQLNLNQVDLCISEQDQRMLHPNILHDFEQILTEAMSLVPGTDENRTGLRRAIVFCGRLLGQDGRQAYADLKSELKRWNGPDPHYKESLPSAVGMEESLLLLNEMAKAYQYSPSHRGTVTSTCIKHARRAEFYRFYQRFEELMHTSAPAIWTLIQNNGFEIPGSPGYWYGSNTHLFVDFFLLKATGLDLRSCIDEPWAWKERRKVFRFIEISKRLFCLEKNFGGGVHAITPSTGCGAYFEKKDFEKDGEFKTSHIEPVMEVIRIKYPWINRMCRYLGRRIVRPFVFEHKDPRQLLDQIGQMYEEGVEELKAWQVIEYH